MAEDDAREATRYNEGLYDRFWAECTDFARYNPGSRHRRRIIAELLRDVPGTSLLDVGCGDGELLVHLRAALPQVRTFWGADLSPKTVERNARALPHMRFEVLDVSAAHLPRRFDIVVCSEVVEHIQDRRPAFENLAAMLADGGHLLVTAPTGRVYDTERAFGHTTHPTLEELRSHGEAAGLRAVETRNWGFPAYRALKWVTNLSAPWALRNFASGRYSAPAKLLSRALCWANYLNAPDHPSGVQLFVLLRRR